jgi:hypothetical protein
MGVQMAATARRPEASPSAKHFATTSKQAFCTVAMKCPLRARRLNNDSMTPCRNFKTGQVGCTSKCLFRTLVHMNVFVSVCTSLSYTYARPLSSSVYRTPSSNAGLSNADSVIRVKINANNYLPNAKKFNYTLSASYAVVAYEKCHRCSKRTKDGLAFAYEFVQQTWFVLFSICKSVNIQLNCHPAISSSRVFHPLFVSQTACNPRFPSRLRCYHGNLCRIVFTYFTVYDIALG